LTLIKSVSKIAIERQNIEEQWLGIIRPIAQAQMPLTNLGHT